MGSISLKSRGSFDNIKNFFNRMIHRRYYSVFDRYAQMGVQLLAANTPIDTGLLASSWSYEIVDNYNSTSIIWKNSDIENGENVALLIQYGHATGTGGYVQGVDYINPALQPLFDKLAEACWKEVKDS